MTFRQKKFVYFFVGESMGNGADAARRAGYGSDAKGAASRLLDDPEVLEALEAKLAEASLSASETLTKLSMIAEGDMSIVARCWRVDEVRDAEDNIVSSREVIDWEKVEENGIGPLIKRVTRTKHGDSLELYSAVEALALLARYHGLLQDRLKIEGQLDFSKLSDDQLRELAAGRRPKGL